MDKHFIVLNGKRYDAVTGAYLGPYTSLLAKPAKQHHKRHPQSSTRHSQAATPKRTSVVDGTITRNPTKIASARPKHHGSPAHVKAHKPQPAKTLMRHAVKKPNHTKSPAVRKQYPLIKTDSGITVQAPKRLAHAVDETRAKRAQQIHKSSHVGRFHAPAHAPIKPQVAPITMAVPSATAAAMKKPVAHARTVSKPAPKKVDIFEQAIANATSHQQPKHKSSATRRRVVNASAAFATVLVLGGFIAVLNQSSLEMQLASARAGFKAQAPSYMPNGYKQEGASVAGKSVVLTYASPNSTYTLTQESSSWDSQTLFDSITSQAGAQYQVIQHNGRIIYVYNGANAAWVDGGILYKLSGTASLSADEIIAIATSL